MRTHIIDFKIFHPKINPKLRNHPFFQISKPGIHGEMSTPQHVDDARVHISQVDRDYDSSNTTAGVSWYRRLQVKVLGRFNPRWIEKFQNSFSKQKHNQLVSNRSCKSNWGLGLEGRPESP